METEPPLLIYMSIWVSEIWFYYIFRNTLGYKREWTSSMSGQWFWLVSCLKNKIILERDWAILGRQKARENFNVSFSRGIISKLNVQSGAGVTLCHKSRIHVIKARHSQGQGGGGAHGQLLQGCTCQQRDRGQNTGDRSMGTRAGLLPQSKSSPKSREGWITVKRERGLQVLPSIVS